MTLKLKQLFFVTLIGFSLNSFGQTNTTATTDTTYWVKGTSISLNFNQAAFSSNWKAGGVNSISFGGLFSTRANYARNKTTWDNAFELQYGVVNNEGQSTRKSADRIYFDTKVGHKLSDSKWSIFGSMNFLTQFTKGYEYGEDAVTGDETKTLISNFMAPGFLTFAWGMEYKPVDFFYVRLSPFAPRFTFVTDDDILDNPETSNYGVEDGSHVRQEWLAFQLLSELNKDVSENLNLKLRYLMYANYEEFSGDKIDHRLDAIITASVTKYINTSLTLNLLYDYDQDDQIQLAQALALGFQYKFGNAAK
ncbi:DUF3078 domain-containing protein [Chondrinema litorale]|uniref:DUF3078 domain-containing protein n=1 Tax=Chondrinema litorale TaxID=2994555 RepID=UPI002543DD54|nr:DUF3078 domain-containing protein [Chondrinema litorale]UZR98633.1 DUF3078 domain-containing protein [Chondrinema litorale]